MIYDNLPKHVLHLQDLAKILFEKLNWYGDITLKLDDGGRLEELTYYGKSYSSVQLAKKLGIDFNNMYIRYETNLELWKKLYGKKN